MGARVMILAAGVGSGHNMAAGVLEDQLRQHRGVSEVVREDVLDSTNEIYRRIYDDGYFRLVAQVPWLVEWGYDREDAPFRLNSVSRWWDRINNTATVRAVRRYQPDIVVCTHFLPARLVSLMIARGALRAALTVVTTDFDFQGMWLSAPLTDFTVARAETKAQLANLGVPPDRLFVTGIPVRAVLGEPVDRAEVLATYRLRPDLPILLISAGAAGGSYTESIVRQTLAMTRDFQAVVVCGRNAELKEEVTQLVADRAERYRVLGFTTDMPDLMRVATLFVGKPGGLSSSECMAASLPMVLINPIPGQEERNSDFLLEEGAAVRCNYATTVGYKIDSLLADPVRLQQMAANARRLGRPDAAAVIAAGALAGSTAPLWISQDAQQSMSIAAEQGLASAALHQGRQCRTLVDLATGRSAAVITDRQLELLGPEPDGSAVRVTARQLDDLNHRRHDTDLAFTVRRALGLLSGGTFGVV